MPRCLRRAETGLFLGIWLVLMVVGRTELFRDPDTFWHTAVGQQILAAGRIEPVDTFSFTFRGHAWIPSEWLGECAMAVLHRVGGWDALLLATAVLLAATYTAVASRLLRAGLGVIPTLLILMVLLAASSHQFHVRPLIVTIALLTWTFLLLADVETGRKPLASLGWLVPCFVLWANAHGGVLAGLGTVGLVAGAWSAQWLAGLGGPIRRPVDLFKLAALLAILTLAVLVNPFGLDLPRTWWTILAMPLPQIIQEHAPLDPTRWPGPVVVLLAVGYLTALAGVSPRNVRATWLVPLVWLALSCQRVRHAPLLSVTAGIALAEVLQHSRWRAWLAERGWLEPGSDERPSSTSPPGPRAGKGRSCNGGSPRPLAGEGQGVRAPQSKPSWQSMLLPAALLLLALGLQAAGVPAPILGRDWVALDATRWPVDLLPELRAVEEQDNPRVFNDYLFGGYLIYHTPRLQVFVDGRCELYGRDFLLSYDRAEQKEPALIEEWYRQYRFGHALVQSGSLFDRHLGSAATWDLVRRAGPATLYRRKAEPVIGGR